MSPDDKAKRVLDPILEVFGGAGGLAFVAFRHRFVPSLYLDATSPLEDDVRVMIEQFSRLCKLALENKI